MARLVMCKATGITGVASDFIKIDGKYYRDQETYEKYQNDKNLHNKIILKIGELLGYYGMVPSQVGAIIGKKVKESKLSYEILYQSLLDKEEYIRNIFAEINNHSKDVQNVIAIFTIIDTIPQLISYGGCYEIKNLDTDEVYIGETIDFFKRINQHISDLYANRHHCEALQKGFNQINDISHFTFTPLYLYEIKSMDREKEKHRTLYMECAYYLKYLHDKRSLYNTVDPYIALKKNSINLENYNIDCNHILDLLLEDDLNILPKKIKAKIEKDLNKK